jgi:hypothetical protein
MPDQYVWAVIVAMIFCLLRPRADMQIRSKRNAARTIIPSKALC